MSKGTFSDNSSQSPCPCSESLLTHSSTGDPPTPAGTFGSVSCWVTAPFFFFFWVLVQAKLCLCPPRLESLFTPVLWKSCNQILLAFKVRFFGDSKSLCWVPRLGSLTWGTELSKQWENFFGIIVLQFAGYSPGGYGIWLHHMYVPPTILL